MSSTSSGGDGGKRIERSQLLLSVEEADQSSNAGGGEGTLKKLSSGGDGGEKIKPSQSLLSVEEADQSSNSGGGEGTLKKLSSGGDGDERIERSRSLLSVEEADQSGNAGGGEGTLKKLSSGGDGGKKGKRSWSLSSVEGADQSGNSGGGEGTLKKSSSGGDGGKKGKHSRSLLSVEEADQSGNSGGGESTLKKGPWTTDEDKILVEHIEKHGEGNWNAVQKYSGLSRCGKSCRLRWANHLRPGLKKGSFTAEEERLIVEFHFLKGSKWAQMAVLLPGRTDNEIKNFWYTRSKKLERAGLPVYPNEITSKCLNGSQESADSDMLANESSQRDETDDFNFDITDLDLTDYKFSPDSLPPFFDKTISDLIGLCSDSSHNTLSMRPSKCPHAAVVPHGYMISSSSVAVPEVSDQYDKYPMLSMPCDPILHTNFLPTGIHAASNISSSEPIYGSMWSELPSLQNLQTRQCSLGAMYASPLPSHESFDPLVQSPPIEPCLPVPSSPDCSHLVDSIVYYNSDQNLIGLSIDSLQAKTDSTAPYEANFNTQWDALDDERAASISRRVGPVETAQDYDIYRGALNDQNLKGLSIDSLQAKTDSTAPYEANFNTQWDALHDERAASISRRVHPVETAQDYDIYRGALNDQNLKGLSIDSLQAKTDSKAPYEANFNTQWDALHDERAASISRRVHPVETAQDYDIYRGALNDQNLKGLSIDSLQAKTDSKAPYEANFNTQWDALHDERAASISRRVHPVETAQDYDIYRGGLNDQLPAYYTSNKEDNGSLLYFQQRR